MERDRGFGNRDRGFDRPPREMHKITCADCGQGQRSHSSLMETDRSIAASVSRSTSRRDSEHRISEIEKSQGEKTLRGFFSF